MTPTSFHAQNIIKYQRAYFQSKFLNQAFHFPKPHKTKTCNLEIHRTIFNHSQKIVMREREKRFYLTTSQNSTSLHLVLIDSLTNTSFEYITIRKERLDLENDFLKVRCKRTEVLEVLTLIFKRVQSSFKKDFTFKTLNIQISPSLKLLALSLLGFQNEVMK